MKKKNFQVLIGKKYDVVASNSEEAEKALHAYINGEPCTNGCEKEACECVEFNEVDTWTEEN